MSRLRIRIELSRGGVGIPLHKLASVIGDTQKFLTLLAEDVGIEKGKGEWLGFDFDRASLDFTAEYVGSVTGDQVKAFNAAFDGTTSLRRDTIAQFARITEAIREDEAIGFGLFESDQGAEPAQWHCLSRRDALRIAEEIQILLSASSEFGQATHLPAAGDPSLETHVFGHRRERGLEDGHVADYVRHVEENLSGRIQRLEERVEEHSGVIQNLDAQWASSEASLRNLVSNIETFCDQASRQIERVAPAALPAASTGSRNLLRRWWPALAAGVVLLAAVLLFHTPGGESPQADGGNPAASLPVSVTAQTVEAASPPGSPSAGIAALPGASGEAPSGPPTAAAGPPMRIDLEAREMTWVSLLDGDGNKVIFRTLEAGETRTAELPMATLRTGNAGALIVRLNGQPIGSLGPRGGIREVEFKNGHYRLLGESEP